jgi:putative hydrolase
MIQDLHLHTNYSDGKNSLEDMIKKAISLNIKEISFTDHVWKTSTWTNDYLNEIKTYQEMYSDKIKIYPGFEAKLINHNGDLDIDDSLYSKDVRVVAAIHRIPIGNGKYIRSSEINHNLELSREMWLKSFSSLINNNRINCIAHPFSLIGYMKINKNDTIWWNKVSNIIESMPFNIEYNVKYENNLVPKWIWEKHKDKVVFGSDSHSTDDLILRNKKLVEAINLFALMKGE